MKDCDRFNQIGKIEMPDSKLKFSLGKVDPSDGNQYIYLDDTDAHQRLMLDPYEANMLLAFLAEVLK